MDAVLDALWRVQNVHQQPALLPTEKFSDEWKDRIWRALPPDILRSELEGWVQRGSWLAWERLSPTHWDAVLDAWRREPTWERRGLEHIPEAHARTVIRERLAGFNAYQIYQTLWARFPELCVEEALRDLVEPPPDGTPDGPLWRVPEGLVGVMIERVRPELARVRASTVARLQLARWAHYQCSNRAKHWLAAWGLLTELEPVELAAETLPSGK